MTDEKINNMDCSRKVKYLKRNPVTVARQSDYIFREVWGKVILSGMLSIGQIFNFHESREFQNRGLNISMPLLMLMVLQKLIKMKTEWLFNLFIST